jgi:rubrerythrin
LQAQGADWKTAQNVGEAVVKGIAAVEYRPEDIQAALSASTVFYEYLSAERYDAIAEAKLEAVDVRSTKGNLEAAIKGESYERDTMYPQFLKQGRADNNREAIRSFNYAKTAETEHARLYTEALNDLANRREKSRTYYVCTVCGYTTTKMDFSKCPSCFNPKEKYEAVG